MAELCVALSKNRGATPFVRSLCVVQERKTGLLCMHFHAKGVLDKHVPCARYQRSAHTVIALRALIDQKQRW